MNRELKPDSKSLRVRNGVGVKSPDEVYFVISEGEVNMRYLDGAIARRLPNREIIEMLVS